jgi:hypothetical protein
LDDAWRSIEAAALERAEIELARVNAQLAEREEKLVRRERELLGLAPEPTPIAEPEPMPVAAPEPAPVAPPEPEPLPVAELPLEPVAVPEGPPDEWAPAPVAERTDEEQLEPGRWRLEDLRVLVEDGAAVFPERTEEWRAYLFYLRDFGDSEGTLAASFDGLVWEVFGPLLERAASHT